jgi:PadR family transcriptional regulator PadR
VRIERELMRGAGPVTVLRLLKQREMYGYELVQALSQRTDGVLAMGQSTLYPLLYSLEAKGLLTADVRVAPSGRRRKYYALTAKGRLRLKAEQAQWQRLLRAMASLGLIDPVRSAR